MNNGNFTQVVCGLNENLASNAAGVLNMSHQAMNMAGNALTHQAFNALVRVGTAGVTAGVGALVRHCSNGKNGPEPGIGESVTAEIATAHVPVEQPPIEPISVTTALPETKMDDGSCVDDSMPPLEAVYANYFSEAHVEAKVTNTAAIVETKVSAAAIVPEVDVGATAIVPEETKVANVSGAAIVPEDRPIIYRLAQAKPKSIAEFMIANAPKEAPVLEEIAAFTPAEAEDQIDEMSARLLFPFSRQNIIASRGKISIADGKIAKLRNEIEAIEQEVRNIRALLPTMEFVENLRQTAASKQSKRILTMAATSCRLEAAKRARLL